MILLICIKINVGSLVESQPLTIEYNLKSTSSGVCITCTFPMESSATECVAVVYQRISQLSSSGLINIELIHQLPRSGDTAYGCIEGIDEDNYQVGVIGAVQVAIDLSENGTLKKQNTLIMCQFILFCRKLDL